MQRLFKIKGKDVWLTDSVHYLYDGIREQRLKVSITHSEGDYHPHTRITRTRITGDLRRFSEHDLARRFGMPFHSRTDPAGWYEVVDFPRIIFYSDEEFVMEQDGCRPR